MTKLKLKDFTDAFGKQNIKFRTDTNGSLITDCPVCALESKGESKARIFADGGFTCRRFAGTGAAEHKREMLTAWDLEPNTKPSAFITETLFDGKLTFEFEPRGKKYQITARNCDSVLAIDEIELNRSDKRAAFVSQLDGFDGEQKLTIHRTLIEIADRCNKTQSAIDNETEPKETHVLSRELSDGRRAEITRQGFAVYDPVTKSTTYQFRLEDDDGKIYLPLDDDVTRDHILLPSGVSEYGSDKELFNDVKSFLYSQVDIPERDLNIVSKYVFLTYLTDKMKTIPYLRTVGDTGSGKTRLISAVGSLCRLPCFTVSLTAAALFRVVDKYAPTMVIDEASFEKGDDDASALMKISLSGYKKGSSVLRVEKNSKGELTPKSYKVYGAKIYAGIKVSDSRAFENRCHKIVMQETRRDDIELIVSDEDDLRAENLRNKLTLWRLRNLDMDVKPRIKAAHEELKKYPIKKRLAEIALPLLALIDDEQLKAEFITSLQNRTSDAVTEKADTTDGQLIHIIWNLIFEKKYVSEKNEADDDFEIVLREYDKSMVHSVEGKPDERLRVGVIAEKLNEGVLERFQKDEVYVGRLLSKMELKSDRISRRGSGEFYQKRAVIFDEARLQNLFENFNLIENQQFSVVTVVSETTSLDTINNLTTETTKESSDDSHCRQVKPLEENDLSKVTTVMTENCEKVIKKEKEDIFEENPDAEICNLIALDTETEPFNKKLGITPRNAKMIGMSISYDGQKADYETDKESWNFLLPDDEQTVVLHNAKFDFGVLQRAGLPVPSSFEDTLIAAHLLDENDLHGLKPLAKKHLGIDDPVTFDEADKMRLLDPEVFAEYARNDARYTFRLWEKFRIEIGRQELTEVYQMEKRLLPVVMNMETRGMKIDTDSLSAIEREVKAESARLKTEIFDLAGMEFELNKPLSVGTVLFDKLGLKCPKQTAKGARSVDSESLKEIAHPLAVKILEYRSIDKLANTFIKVLPKFADENGRIHPEFKPLGAATGRFSCADPNVQQIPNKSELGKAVRRAFICDAGNKLIVADFSQMELRVLAHYSQDETLLKAYCTGEETDLHTITAQKIFAREDVDKNERGIAKMINFGIAYGITDVGLYRRLTATGISTTPEECKRYIDDYFKTYKGVDKFLKKVKKTIQERGYVKNLFGRRRRLKGLNAREFRQAQNFIIQATSADLVKRAMVALDKKLPEEAQLISMIHDELIIECRADHAEEVLGIVVEVMQDTPEGFTVPMPVDAKIVDCWADAK